MTGFEALLGLPEGADAWAGARRVGFFGGSFDPLHAAHLSLARQALAQLRLDRVVWIPSGHAWYKARTLTGAAHRLAMLRLALAEEPRFVVSEVEVHRTEPSYTVDTLTRLGVPETGASTPACENAQEYFWILGQDQYAKLHTWHDWSALLRRVTLVVAARGDEAPQASPQVQAEPHRLEVLRVAPSSVSSTALRQAIESGGSPEGLSPALPLPVARYIAAHGLYRHHQKEES